MLILLQPGLEPARVSELRAEAERRGLRCTPLAVGDRTALHVTRGETRRARGMLRYEGVQALLPTSGPRVRREGRRFFPYHLLNWCSAGLLLSASVVLLAGQLPPGIGPAPDPLAAPPPILKPWWLSWASPLLAQRPGWVGPAAAAALLLLLLALPTLDRLLAREKEAED